MSEIRPNQKKAIQTLAAGGTVQQAALAADVTERTIYLWRSDSVFKAELQRVSSDMMEAAVTTVTAAVAESIRVLRIIQADKENPPATRVSAARAILDTALRLHERYTLEQRIAALEAKASES